MKLPILLSFVFLANLLSAQSRIDFIKSEGYQIVEDDFLMRTERKKELAKNNDTTNREIPKQISKRQFQALLENNVFNYFFELYDYDTPLQQKLFKSDNASKYNMYVDSLVKIKSIYKSTYEFIDCQLYSLGNYDLVNKRFSVKSPMGKNSQENSKTKTAIQNGNIYLENQYFTSISNLNQEITSSFYNLYDITTHIKITEERKALMVEQSNPFHILILFNRFDVSGKIYKPRKVLFCAGDSIIESFGVDKQIDSLLNSNVPTNTTIYSEEKLRNLLQDSDDLHDKSGSSEGRKGDHNSSIGYGYSERNLYQINQPELLNNCSEKGIVMVEVIVNTKGDVTKANPISSGSTTMNKCLIKAAREYSLKCKFQPNEDRSNQFRNTIKVEFN